MDRQQQGNLLIGAGVLVGLGTAAYWLLNGGWQQVTGDSAAMGPYVPEGTGPLPGMPALGPSAAVTPSLEPSASWLPAAPSAPSVVEQRVSERGY